MNKRFSDQVLTILHLAGWREGRIASTQGIETNKPMPFDIAQEILKEFAGLKIGYCGPGKECATSDVEINPALTNHLLPELQEYEKILNTNLFALGEVHRGHAYLVIDARGRTYLLSDTLEPLAESFSLALDKLLLGFLPDKQDCKNR